MSVSSLPTVHKHPCLTSVEQTLTLIPSPWEEGRRGGGRERGGEGGEEGRRGRGGGGGGGGKEWKGGEEAEDRRGGKGRFYSVHNLDWLPVIHTNVVLVQAVTLNVAINSFSKALLTIMVSNNFVELKGSVFKKFETNNLFQMSCSGELVDEVACTKFALSYLHHMTVT